MLFTKGRKLTMKTLTEKQIFDTLNEIHNGSATRVTYKSELPLKAEFKKQGYQVIKVTETTGRFGVNYHKIATVIARKAEQQLENTRNYTNPYEWVIANKVKKNIKNGTLYVVLAGFNGGENSKSQYKLLLNGQDTNDSSFINKQEFMDKYKDMVINSYWNKPNTSNEIKTIKFDNILHIKDLGERITF